MNSVLRFAFMLVACADLATAAPFVLAPAVAVEAEDFTIGNGWRVVRNGQGNYMVDIIGFQHISGERLLGTDSNATASAFADITVPQASDYRLWVRYEYPPFSDTRFNVAVQQGGKEILSAPMGAKDNPRYAFGETARPQYDPAWGPEGLVEEVVTVRGLQAGPARLCCARSRARRSMRSFFRHTLNTTNRLPRRSSVSTPRSRISSPLRPS